jgi:hypothetical protein
VRYRRYWIRQKDNGAIDVVSYGLWARILGFFAQWALLIVVAGAVLWVLSIGLRYGLWILLALYVAVMGALVRYGWRRHHPRG